MSVHRLYLVLKRPYVLVAFAFIISDMGSKLLDGAMPSLIALGFLPIVFLPLYATLENVTDGMAFLVSHVIGRCQPMIVLLWCDIYDLLLTAITLINLYGFPHHSIVVMVIYFILICPIPVFIDVADEMYAGQLATQNHEVSARFNAIYSSMISFMSLVIASPVGNLLVGLSINTLLWGNILLTLVAVVVRGGLIRIHPSVAAGEAQDIEEDEEERFSLMARLGYFRQHLPVMTSMTPGAPAFSPVTMFILSMADGYLLLWVLLHYSGNRGVLMAIFTFFTGLAATLGPQLSLYLRKYISNETQIHGGILVMFLTHAGLIIDVCFWGSTLSRPFLIIILTCLVISTIAASCFMQANMIERQKRFAASRNYAQIIGISFSLSALLALAAAWLKYAALAYQYPLPVMIVGTFMLAVMWGWLRKMKRRNG